mmetsp:Transcript_45267/g.108212  ORF Transcript_45267/g.108212 Transcript_45267/m.108212 type:complete len:200 (+) Transcript_45267:161-760(+)
MVVCSRLSTVTLTQSWRKLIWQSMPSQVGTVFGLTQSLSCGTSPALVTSSTCLQLCAIVSTTTLVASVLPAVGGRGTRSPCWTLSHLLWLRLRLPPALPILASGCGRCGFRSVNPCAAVGAALLPSGRTVLETRSRVSRSARPGGCRSMTAARKYVCLWTQGLSRRSWRPTTSSGMKQRSLTLSGILMLDSREMMTGSS